MARAVRDRDGTCRFPGCVHPAERCDLDHVRAHPSGATSGANLQSLHRGHHHRKTTRHWRARMTPDGVVTWTTPLGRTEVTYPFDHRPAGGDPWAHRPDAEPRAEGHGEDRVDERNADGPSVAQPGPPPF